MEVFDLENPGHTITVDNQSPVQEKDYNDRLISKRDNLIKGNFNVLPIRFKRMSYYLPGLEKGTYLIVTAETKNGKTIFASQMFLLSQLWEAYHNSKFKVKYLYFNAEESQEVIKDRIVCYLLHKYTNGNIRISSRDLNSTTIPLSQEVIDVLEDDGFKDIRDFFFNHIEFNDVTYPTGIEIAIRKYVEQNGKIQRGESFTIEDPISGKKSVQHKIIGYEPYDKDVFTIVFFDNFNNITPERGQTLLQAITNVSKCLKDARNRYGLTIVALQQQNAESDSNEAFKIQRVEPTQSRLQDCKMTSKDAQIVIGAFCPTMKFEGLPNGDPRKQIYRGYNIQKFGTYFRSLHILLDRNGECAKVFPMYFDGMVSDIRELPKVDDSEKLQKFYDIIDEIHQKEVLDQQIKEEYKRTNGIGASFFTVSNNFNNKVAKDTFKQYLCRVFHKIFN